MALLLLLLMPLGLLHRSSTGACRSAHHAVLAGSGAAVADVRLDAAFTTWAAHDRLVDDERHDHSGSGLPLDGAPPVACGPAAVVERPTSTSGAPYQSALPAWRARSPVVHATPPPAPPPRLS